MILLQINPVSDARRKLLLVMAHHNQCLSFLSGIGIDDATHLLPVRSIESVKRFVQNQEVGFLDEGPCQKHQTLLPARKLEETTFLQGSDTEYIHPMPAHLLVLGLGAYIQTHRVVQSACHDVDGGQVLQVSPMHLRADVSDVFLDFPNALSRAALASEEGDVASITLRIVRTYQAQQGGLSRAVFARECPFLAFAHHPVESVQNDAFAIADADFVEADDFGSIFIFPMIVILSNIVIQSVAKDLGSIHFMFPRFFLPSVV